jgi:hypothetical protein
MKKRVEIVEYGSILGQKVNKTNLKIQSPDPATYSDSAGRSNGALLRLEAG